MEFICNICGLEFENKSLLANHIRWKHNNQSDYIKVISDDKKIRDIINLGEIINFMVECSNCHTEFIIKERKLKFPTKEKYYCCISCANTRSHSKETIKKISEKVKLCWKNDEYVKICINNNNFKNRSSSKGEREIRTYLKGIFGNSNVSAHRLIKLETGYHSVDLTIKNKNIIIEYDGIWHFDKEIYEKFGTPEKFLTVINKDIKLKEYCKNNNIRLLRVSDKYYNHNKQRTKVEIVEFIKKLGLMYKELY